jgi:hypothetical protein
LAQQKRNQRKWNNTKQYQLKVVPTFATVMMIIIASEARGSLKNKQQSSLVCIHVVTQTQSGRGSNALAADGWVQWQKHYVPADK